VFVMSWVGINPVKMSSSVSTLLFHGQNVSHVLQFIVLLMMDAKGVRNIQNILVVLNKHNTARVASCWFIIYYRLVMHGNSNIKCLFWPVMCYDAMTFERRVTVCIAFEYLFY